MANSTLSTNLGIASTTVILQDMSNSFINEITTNKEAMMTPQPLYTKDSSETEVFDFGGCTKTISLRGKYYGATQDDCRLWVQNIEAFIQGQQDKASGYPLTFVDDFRAPNGMKVKIMNFESIYTEGSVFLVDWTLKIVEASDESG